MLSLLFVCIIDYAINLYRYNKFIVTNIIVLILYVRFTRLECNVKLWLLGRSRFECGKLSNVSADIEVAIFRVNSHLKAEVYLIVLS
jgi:hypothetical protein